MQYLVEPELGSQRRTGQGSSPATPRAVLDENDIALAKRISDSMGFNILDLNEGAITLASRHRELLRRMPDEMVEDLDPEPGIPVPGVERVTDVYGLFLPLLMEVFLRHQSRNLDGLQWYRGVAAYVDDSWWTVDFLLGTVMYPYDHNVRLEPSVGCDLLTIGGACSLAWAHKRYSDVHPSTAVKDTWMDWVTHVLEDPTIIRPAAGGLDDYGQWVPDQVGTESGSNTGFDVEPDPLGAEGRTVGGGVGACVPASTAASVGAGGNPDGEPLWESLEETLERINREIETVPDLFETHIVSDNGDGDYIW